MNVVSRRAACEFVVAFVAILAVMTPTAQGQSTATSSATPAQTITVRGPVTTVPSRDWLDYAQLVAIGLAFVTILVIRQQLRSSDRASRQERSAEQAAVWMNRDFREVLSPVWSFFEVSDVDDCIAKVRAWVTAPHSEDASLPGAENGPLLKKNDINHVLGVIEEAAVRYNRGAVDRDWVERLLGPAFVAMFDRCLWFLVFFRVQEGWPSMCNEWEAMVRDLRESRTVSLRSIHIVRNIRALQKRRRQQSEGTYAEITTCRMQRVRVICVPPSPETATAELWDQSRQLSSSLAVDHNRIVGFGGPPGPGAAAARWTAIVIPTSIDYTKEDVERDSALRGKLEAYLISTTAAADSQEPSELTSTAEPKSSEGQ